MQHLASLERRARIRTALWLLSAAATIAFALHLGTQSKPLGLLLLVAFALTQLPPLLRQLRFRRLMRSGDLGKVLKAYHPTLARLPHPETLGPLMVAAALAAAFASDPTARVLTVEADLGAPALGRALGLDVMPTTDFGKQLGARVEGAADGHWYVLNCSPALHVLAAKEVAPELVLSTHFEDCVAALRPFYDVSILRAPAVTETVACRAVSDVVDGVVVLVSASENSDVQVGQSALSLFGQKRLSLELRV